MSKTMDVAIGLLRCTLRFGDKTGSRESPSGQGLELSVSLRSRILMTWAGRLTLGVLST
jgi:hypothetical protein